MMCAVLLVEQTTMSASGISLSASTETSTMPVRRTSSSPEAHEAGPVQDGRQVEGQAPRSGWQPSRGQPGAVAQRAERPDDATGHLQQTLPALLGCAGLPSRIRRPASRASRIERSWPMAPPAPSTADCAIRQVPARVPAPPAGPLGSPWPRCRSCRW